MSRLRDAATAAGRAIGAAAATVGGAVIVHGGLGVGALQRVAPGTQRGRPLTAAEEQVLREVFDDAVPLGEIRIVADMAGTGVFGVSDQAFTLGTTIYLKGDQRSSLLVHECVHVWQYRTMGPRYAADAVVAQNVGHGYDWRAEVAGGATRWTDINVEGQAQFVQDLYDGGTGVEQGQRVTGGGAYFRSSDADRDFPGHRALAEDALGTIRGQRRGD